MKTKKILRASLLVILTIALTSNLLQAQQLQLSASNYNGFNISCFGGSNGNINLTITGGTAPFSILWSNNATSEDIADVPSGYYRVTVDDADTSTAPVEAEITMTEPRQISLEITNYKYPNDFNISLYGACNGSITLTPLEGVAPYSFSWSDNFGNQNRSAVCAGNYQVTVIDANGCEYRSDEFVLTQPERSDWQMSGNTNTNPTTQFLGTSDNTDLVFKTNNVESFRIKANGQVDFAKSVNFNESLLFGNDNLIGYRAATSGIPKIISIGSAPNTSLFTVSPCYTPDPFSTFQFNGLIQSYGIPPNGTNYNVMQMGFDGMNCIIETMGSSPDPNGNRLLLNYNCGKDVFVGNDQGWGGNLTANNNVFVHGLVGIGTDDPKGFQNAAPITDQKILHIKGVQPMIRLENIQSSGDEENDFVIKAHNGMGRLISNKGIVFFITAAGAQPDDNFFTIIKNHSWFDPSTLEPEILFKVNSEGYVGARGLRITASSFADYVFSNEYKLMPIPELDKYIKANNRLPGIPSASEVIKEGIDVETMLVKQMEKIEELTLYLIHLSKENEDMKQVIDQIKKNGNK